jgi:2-polyprenyl-3-methyl-5-hydroxy-6-metoxy-1,4-benzoquinol methylase
MQTHRSIPPPDYSGRIYANAGNPGVIAMVGRRARTVLDVGCGAGDNAALLKARDPAPTICGITASEEESALARRHMETVWVMDLEAPLPKELASSRFDTILCSHVLEHLRDPAEVVARLAQLLAPGGQMVIAVPNVLSWRQRFDFVAGRFVYTSGGVMDETHLRFYTYETAPRYLLTKAPALRIVEQRAVGSVPLWFLRRKVLSARLCAWIDEEATRLRPNLFAVETILLAEKL